MRRTARARPVFMGMSARSLNVPSSSTLELDTGRFLPYPAARRIDPMRSRAGRVARSMRRKNARAMVPPAMMRSQIMSVPEVDDFAEDERADPDHHEHADDELVNHA